MVYSAEEEGRNARGAAQRALGSSKISVGRSMHDGIPSIDMSVMQQSIQHMPHYDQALGGAEIGTPDEMVPVLLITTNR